MHTISQNTCQLTFYAKYEGRLEMVMLSVTYIVAQHLSVNCVRCR